MVAVVCGVMGWDAGPNSGACPVDDVACRAPALTPTNLGHAFYLLIYFVGIYAFVYTSIPFS